MAIDATTQAEVEKEVFHWRILCYADFDGDVLRATSGLYDKVVSGSGDSELDGTYESFDHNLIEISPVDHSETGAGTVTISMSGLVVNDADFLNLIGDKSKWQGRTARLWFYCVDSNETQVGEIIPYYTGFMNDVVIGGSPDLQRVTLSIENYLVTISGASGKNYLMQTYFDSGDLSPAAMIAAANGMNKAVDGVGGGYRNTDNGGGPSTRRVVY